MDAIGGSVALLIGIVLVGAFAATFLKSFKTRKWVPAPGVVTASSIETRMSGDGTSSYAPLVAYRYEFRGYPHVGNSVRLMGTAERYRHHAEKVVSAYPAGARVTVYVDDNAPSQSVLQPGIEWLAGVAICFGLGLIVFAVSIFSRS